MRSADAQEVLIHDTPDPANVYVPSAAAVLECFRLLVDREGELQPSSDFIEKRLTEHKREILMQWVLEVSESFKMDHCTSAHMTNLIDRTLEKVPVMRHVALIGLACILISSKFIEHPVSVQDLQQCAPIYTKADILKMERKVRVYVYVHLCVCACVCWVCMYGCLQVLETLNWDLKVVTASEIMQCVVSQFTGSKRVAQLSELLIDIAQSKADPIWWLGQRRSTMGLGAVLASLNILGQHFPNFEQFLNLADENAVQAQCDQFLCLYKTHCGNTA